MKKQKAISYQTGWPSKREGKDGDTTVRRVPGRGTFFLYKMNGIWYSSRLSRYKPTDEENNTIVKLPLGKIPLTPGEITLYSSKLKIKTSANNILSIPDWNIHQHSVSNVSPDEGIHPDNIEFDTLADLTADIGAGDELFVLEYKDADPKQHKRKAINEIKLSAFNNDLTTFANITSTGTLDISGGTLTTSAAQKKAIVEGVGANTDIGAYEFRAQTFESDVSTGTAPFTVASTTVVTNLNADKLDGADLVDEDNMSSNSATKVPTQQSVKAYVDTEIATEISALVNGAPGALDTLNELAAALNDDASFSTTVTNSLATKVSLTGNETITGQKTFNRAFPQVKFTDDSNTDYTEVGLTGNTFVWKTSDADINFGWRDNASNNILDLDVGDKCLTIADSNQTTFRLKIGDNGRMNMPVGGLEMENDHGYFGSFGKMGLTHMLRTSHQDLIRHQTPLTLERWNGSAWVDAISGTTSENNPTTNLTGLKNTLDGERNTAWQLDDEWRKFRFVIERESTWADDQCFYVDTTWSSTSYSSGSSAGGSMCPTMTVEMLDGTFNDSDDSANDWTTHTPFSTDWHTTGISDQWGLLMYYKNSGVHSNDTHVRITIEFPAWDASAGGNDRVNIKNIGILNTYVSDRNTGPWTTDWDRNADGYGDVNIPTGHSYKINASSVLSATTLGSGVLNSSLTSVGTISTGVWQGTAIGASYVATLNQDTTGTAAIATTVTITDNESTDENNAIIFAAGADTDGGNLGLESDGNFTYNPSDATINAGKLNLSGSGINITSDSATELNFNGGDNTNITSAGHMYLKAASTKKLYFGAGGTDSLVTLNTDGTVGIGTTSPTHLLHLDGDNADGEAILVEGHASYGGTIRYQRGTSYSWRAGVGGGSSTNSNIPASYWGIEDVSDSHTPALVIAHSTQNVGIGLTNPTETLHVDGNVKAVDGDFSGDIDIDGTSNLDDVTMTGTVQIQGGFRNDGDIDLTNAAIDIDLTDNNASALSFDSSGKAGILEIVTTNSSEKVKMSGRLDVSGITNITGTYLNVGGGYGSSGSTLDSSGNIQANGYLHVDGNVGIGTTTTVAPLTIKSNSTSSANSGFTLMDNSNTNPVVQIGEKSTDGGRLHMYDGGTLKVSLYTDGTDNFINAGNVGIGTTSPSVKLHVDSSTSDTVAIFKSSDSTARIQIQDDDTTNHIVSNNSTLSLGANNTTHAGNLNIDSSGNVGIGNTSPNHLLHVGDDVSMTFTTTPDKAIQLSSTTGGHEVAYILGTIEGGGSDYNIRSKYFVDDATQYAGWDTTYTTGLVGYEWKVAGTQKMKLDTSGNITPGGYIELTGAPSDPGADSTVRLGENGNVLQIYSNYGEARIGAMNAGWLHFYTDRDKNYWNNATGVYAFDEGGSVGEIVLGSYSTDDLILRRDYNDTDYNQIKIGDDTLEIKLDNDVRLAIDSSGVVSAVELDISGDVDVDGTLEADAITVNGTALNTVIAGVTVTNATNATNAGWINVTANNSEDATHYITMVDGTSSNQEINVDTSLTWNPSSNILTTNGEIVTALSMGGHTVDDIDIAGEFVDTDEHLMTSAAIQDKIEGYSYFASSGGTLTGDLTINSPASKLIFRGDDTSVNHEIESDGNLYITADDDNDDTSNFIQFRANGATNLMRIQDDAKVGIGTDSPTSTLHISDASSSGVHSLSLNDRVKVRGDGVVTWGSAAAHGTLSWDSGKAVINSQGTNDLQISAGGNHTDHIYIDGSGSTNDGCVGIGTNSPSWKLHVSGSLYATSTFRTNGVIYQQERAAAATSYATLGQLWTKNDTPNNLYFTDDAGTDIAITNNGALAIPDSYLKNDADDTTSGTITAGGFTTTGTWTFDEHTSGTVGITTVQDSGTNMVDNDTSLLTAGAIVDYVTSLGYTTNTGDITRVHLICSQQADPSYSATLSVTSGNADFNLTSGTGVTVAGNSDTNVATFSTAAAQTGISSILNTSLVAGRDADNQVKFSTDDQIIFRVAGGDGVTFKGSGEIEATKFTGAPIWKEFPFIASAVAAGKYYFRDVDDLYGDYRKWDAFDASPISFSNRNVGGSFVVPDDCTLVGMVGEITNFTNGTDDAVISIYVGTPTEAASNTTLEVAEDGSGSDVVTTVDTDLQYAPHSFSATFGHDLTAGDIVVPMISKTGVGVSTPKFIGSLTLKFITR